jgi:uncharacterized protein (UPF0179 family)
MMPLVTLIGERLAKEGKVIIFHGVSMGCKDCKLKSVCLNLDEGSRYVIRNVRENSHECKIHDGNVRVVEIERVPLATAVAQKNVVEGALVTYNPVNCNNPGCVHFRKCRPVGLKKGTKGKVVRLGSDMSCPRGHKLVEIDFL